MLTDKSGSLLRLWYITIFLLLSFFFMSRHPVMGQGLFVIEASRSHCYYTQQDSSGQVIRMLHVAETTRNIQWRKISKPLAGFESAIQARDRLQSHTLDGEATVVGFISKVYNIYLTNINIVSNPRAGLPRIRGLTSGRGKTSLVHCVQTGFAALAACIQTVLRAVSADVKRRARVCLHCHYHRLLVLKAPYTLS